MASELKNNRGMGAGIAARSNWLSSLNWQIDFYQRSAAKRRVDCEFDYVWLERSQTFAARRVAKAFLGGLLRQMHIQHRWGNQVWLNDNANLLWEARRFLEDGLSKLLFDNMLILRCCTYRHFYYPRIDFDDLVSVVSEEPFLSADLPLDYSGLPLRVFKLELHQRDAVSALTVVSTKAQINLLNSYRQYFVRRESIDLTPVAGDVVLDCGACIGEVSVLLARLVGTTGQVHLFDPVPLHARYCQLQASLNPVIAHVLHINVMAVSDISGEARGLKSDSSTISPGGLTIDSYSMTSLDEYVSRKKLTRVDTIKMDIEGAEMAALEGASKVIREFKPRLAISAYHKPADLWEIPDKLKMLNSDCKLFFGHHSPIQWESVYYAA